MDSLLRDFYGCALFIFLVPFFFPDLILYVSRNWSLNRQFFVARKFFSFCLDCVFKCAAECCAVTYSVLWRASGRLTRS
jgi:hypothetical protein